MPHKIISFEIAKIPSTRGRPSTIIRKRHFSQPLITLMLPIFFENEFLEMPRRSYFTIFNSLEDFTKYEFQRENPSASDEVFFFPTKG